MSERADVAVVGGGPAGLVASIELAARGHFVVLIDPIGPGGRLVNLPEIHGERAGDPVAGGDLASDLTTRAMDARVDIRFDEVLAITPGPVHVVRMHDGELEAPVVILATGTDDAPLPVSGAEALHGRGVSYCVGCDGPMFRETTVAVIGNGEHAARAARQLAKLDNDVVVLFRESEFAASPVDVAAIEAEERVTVLPQTEVICVEETDGRLSALRVRGRDGDAHLPAKGVFYFGAPRPRSALVTDLLVLDERGFVATGPDLSTAVPGLFAVGDVRSGVSRTVASAIADGAIVAAAITNYLAIIAPH